MNQIEHSQETAVTEYNVTGLLPIFHRSQTLDGLMMPAAPMGNTVFSLHSELSSPLTEIPFGFNNDETVKVDQSMSVKKINQNTMQNCIPFPWKVHEMLDDAASEGIENIVAWLPDRISFKVFDTDLFVAQILPRYFNQTKYKSFQRQLNIWGFSRIQEGPGRGGYTHTCFVRGKASLCRHMIRTKVKGTGQPRKSILGLVKNQETSPRKTVPAASPSLPSLPSSPSSAVEFSSSTTNSMRSQSPPSFHKVPVVSPYTMPLVLHRKVVSLPSSMDMISMSKENTTNNMNIISASLKNKNINKDICLPILLQQPPGTTTINKSDFLACENQTPTSSSLYALSEVLGGETSLSARDGDQMHFEGRVFHFVENDYPETEMFLC